MKIAAAEAQWNTCQPCSFSLFQIGGGKDDQTPTQIIEIPHLLSLLATNSWNGEVEGLNQLKAHTRSNTGPATTCPNVFIQYWSMRVMAYLASLVAAVRAVGRVAAAPEQARALEVVPADRDLGRGDAVPDEHRRLDAHRERPPALDRPGPDEDH